MCNLFDCRRLFIVIQLTLLCYLLTTIKSELREYFFDTTSSELFFERFGMPVTTRSMMKRGLQPPPGSAGLLTCPTCCTDGNTIDSSSSTKLLPLESSSSVPELVNQCNASISSSEPDDSSLLSNDDEFEISNFENFELLSNASVLFSNNNLNSCHCSKMESTVQPNASQVKNDSVPVTTPSTGQEDIMQMLGLISTKMMTTIQELQTQMQENELKFSSELQRINQENERFRQDLLSSVQQNLSSGGVSSINNAPLSSMNSNNTTPLLPVPLSSNPAVGSSGNSSDFQTQLMTMLTETFSKLTTVMSDSKSTESKSDWPKFSGDTKKFRHWYLAIVAQLSLAPWKEFYDSTTNTVLTTTLNTNLNEKLYAKLLLCLENQVFQDMVSRKHLRGNGLLLLTELSQTYRPSHVPEVTAAKTVEFWSTMKRQSNESVDTYYNRFQSFLDDLEEAGEPIPRQSAIRQFLFTLGPDFSPIQNNFRIGLLPDSWKTTDWPTLLVLCRDYANSVRPQGHKIESSHDISFDRAAHHKKVKQWFMNPAKFQQEMDLEQAKHVGKCLYHLTKSHQTPDCYIKKECEKLIVNKKSSGSNTSSRNVPSGQLRNIKEEVDEESVDDVSDDMLPEPNDTNEDELAYFARIKNHYLRLVQSKSSRTTTRHTMKFPIIVDSGANYHMFKEREFFTTLTPTSGQVILGDGKSVVNIKGIGQVKCIINNETLLIDNVRFVPDLAESIYSLFVHIKQQQHGVYSSFDDGLFLKFPSFTTKAIVGRDDIYLDAVPFSVTTDTNLNPSMESFVQPCCRHIIQQSYTTDTLDQDNVLQSLRQYYADVKTKRQLNLDVPAGFRPSSRLQKDFNLFAPPCKSRSAGAPDISILDDTSSTINVECPNVSTFSSLLPDPPSFITNPSTNVNAPILRCVDKPSSSLPSKITFTEDFLRASVGFRRVDTIKSKLSTLYQHTVLLDSAPADAILDPGELSNIRKSPRNTTPLVRPQAFGDVIHMDIVFGPDIAIGNVHYGLIFTDRFSRMTYIYPLQNLTSDIKKQLETFFSHLGCLPKRLITDFDTKLIGGKAREYLNGLLIHTNAAPAYRQDKNGLAERHWQTLVAMARSWLASAELPGSFWFYAVKRAAETCNYFPTKLECGTWSTPLELAHGIKPDLRVLFKLFGVAAVRRERQGDQTLGKFDSQSVPMIAVGRCPNSNGIQFYNPSNGTFVSSIDYKFQPNVTSGSFFGLKYQSGTFIYRLDETTYIHAPKFLLNSQVYVHTHSPPSVAKVIGIPTYDTPNIYTVCYKDGSIAEYLDDQLSAVNSTVSTKPTLLPNWIKGGCNATLFLADMPKPRHGKLQQSSDNCWHFFPGKGISDSIPLRDLEANCQTLLDSGQLFRGHTKFRNVYDTRNQVSLQQCVLRHVSAHGLHSLIAPASLKHHSKMTPSDKAVWDAAYDEEYDGLTALPSWEVVTEDQYYKLSKGKKALPTMAIATIKYDANNKPKRAKYRIVVLGNLDYHTWSKEDTAAPVLSQLELRLLTSLAVYNK